MSRPVSELEARALSREAQAAAQARLALLDTAPRLPEVVILLLPGLLVLLFGEHLQRSLGVTFGMVWVLASLVVGVYWLAHRVVVLERRVKALIQLLKPLDA
jgi:hypothetical protein